MPWRHIVGKESGTGTLRRQSSDFESLRIGYLEGLTNISGAIPMQQNYWITRGVSVLVTIAAAAFACGNASADGYQRRGVVPVAGCANFGGFYLAATSVGRR